MESYSLRSHEIQEYYHLLYVIKYISKSCSDGVIATIEQDDEFNITTGDEIGMRKLKDVVYFVISNRCQNSCFKICGLRNNEYEGECSICYDKINEFENIPSINCDHVFHDRCLTPWLDVSDTCPMSRHVMFQNKYKMLHISIRPPSNDE